MKEIPQSYHIEEVEKQFIKEEDGYYRHNKIMRSIIDKRTGELLEKTLLIENDAKVLYDEKFIV